jgi:hypothetical protein
MRLGCIGCLLVLLALVIFGVAAAGAIFFSVNIFDEPEVQIQPFTTADGYRAQQKLYEIVLRDSERSGRADPIVFTERELNAFLSRHLIDAAGLSFSPISVALLPDKTIEFRGRTALRNLMQGIPFAQLAPYLPRGRTDQPVWVRVRGQLTVERGTVLRDRQFGRFEVAEFALGTQPIGAWVLKFMLGQAGRHLFRFPVPKVVQDVAVDDGRLVIRTGAQ